MRRRIFSPDFILFFLLCAVIIAAINVPLFTRFKDTPPDRFFSLVHHGVEDYYLYLSTIRESKLGAWMSHGVYTALPTRSSIFYAYFILVGKLASVFSLTPIGAYHVGRVISLLIFIISSYAVCAWILKKNQALWAAIAGMFSTIPMGMVYDGAFHEKPVASWWWNMSPIGRLDHLPHHAFGIGLLCISFLCLDAFTKDRKTKYLISGIGLAFATGIFFPPAGLAFVISSSVAVGIMELNQLILHKRLRPLVIGQMSIILAGAASLIIMKLETLKGFPWSQWSLWDMGLWNDIPDVNSGILMGGSVLLFASLPAIAVSIRGATMAKIFLIVWGFLPYVLLPFTNVLGISRIRVLFMGNFIPLGILATQSVMLLVSALRLPRIIYMISAVVFILTAVPVSWYFYWQRVQLIPPGYANIEIPRTLLTAFQFLDSHATDGSVILSEASTGNMLPAFASVRSFFGHVSQTDDFGRKESLISRFFQGAMTPEEARLFLTGKKVDFIFSGPFEKRFGADILQYNLPLEEVYSQDGILIYRLGAI